jgi:hypothetical protein
LREKARQGHLVGSLPWGYLRERDSLGKVTIREMLVNAAYCGYVCGLRSKDRSVRGLHEPLVSEELLGRVQEIRAWRARVLKPGRPSEDYLLRKLLYCERCGARMTKPAL